MEIDDRRTILHCDMNAFYASVELLARPDLTGVPAAVCGDPESRRGIVLAKNEEAKRFGVVTAETIFSARRKCPGLVLLKAHHEKYQEYCEKINAIYGRFTDQVEPFSIDESWLDVTRSHSLFGTGEEIAYRIKDTIKKELDLTQSIGVSFNKIFAKMGSDYKKPDAVTLITKENFRELLWPLSARELFSVGSATAAKLTTLGVKTIGDLARTDLRTLRAAFGKQGEVLYLYANGLENAPVAAVSEHRKIKSVGNGCTFKRDLIGERDIQTGLVALSDTVAGRLRKYRLRAGGVKVDIKDPDFKTISRQTRLSQPTNLAETLRVAAMELVRHSWSMKAPIRLLTVTAIQLQPEEGAAQLSFLPAEEGIDEEKSENLERAMDHIRRKYGDGSITFGRVLGNDIGIGIEMDQHQEED